VAVINWERVDELRDEIGADGFVEVVALFLDEADEAVARLDGGTAAGLAADLHFLKGAALNLGLSRLADLCQQGERAAARGEGGTVDVAVVRQTYALAREALLAGLAGRPAA
jgi:HPt (histidine-containing phosphotransfer) domain-containing protein